MKDVSGKIFKENQLVLWHDFTFNHRDTMSLTHKLNGKLYASANNHLVALDDKDSAYPFTVYKDNATDEDLLKEYTKSPEHVDLGTLTVAFNRIAWYMGNAKQLDDVQTDIGKLYGMMLNSEKSTPDCIKNQIRKMFAFYCM